jgi:hypothetical protein
MGRDDLGAAAHESIDNAKNGMEMAKIPIPIA